VAQLAVLARPTLRRRLLLLLLAQAPRVPPHV